MGMETKIWVVKHAHPKEVIAEREYVFANQEGFAKPEAESDGRFMQSWPDNKYYEPQCFMQVGIPNCLPSVVYTTIAVNQIAEPNMVENYYATIDWAFLEQLAHDFPHVHAWLSLYVGHIVVWHIYFN